MAKSTKPQARLKPASADALLLSLDQAAAALSVSRRTIEARIKAGTFPARRLGGRVLVSRADLAEWVQALPKVTPAD